MRVQIGAALLAASALAGCMGPAGNPNDQAYVTDAGGMIAAAPQILGTVSYDPYGKPSNFSDMDIGSSAIAPTASPPLNFTPQAGSPMSARPGPMPR